MRAHVVAHAHQRQSVPSAATFCVHDSDAAELLEDYVLGAATSTNVSPWSSVRQKARLVRERDNLVDSIACGMPPASVAPHIRKREAEITRLDAEIAKPRPQAVDRDELRAALARRTAEWRQMLRGEPKVARLLVRRLLEPLEMAAQTFEECERITRWEAAPRPEGLLTGGCTSCGVPNGEENQFRRSAGAARHRQAGGVSVPNGNPRRVQDREIPGNWL